MDEDHLQYRRSALTSLCQSQLDLLIVGGGIVGAGIARDAALRGLKTGLVEQHDIASGTSSRSSRLLHGGLRYLAQGRIGLVHEASVEKSVVHRIAPHISAPLAFIFPTYQAKPWDQWALWKLRIGVVIYDLLCQGRNLGRSRSLGVGDVTRALPGISRDRLTGGVRYFDGLTHDARLVLDTLRSAANADAIVLNYCRATEPDCASGLWRCRVVDELTGETREVVSRCVVNATGPWAEQFEQSSLHLRLTKGVHLVVDRARLAVPDAVVITEGLRILFAIPWGERVILGTTDTDFEGRPEDVCVEIEDMDYVLGAVNRAFPDAGLSKADVLSCWAGLRPLIADLSGKPSDISRSHEIRMPRPGWLDVAGGKLTTYRLMAQQSVDRVQKYLGLPASACATANLPLLPAEDADGISGIVPPEPSRELVEHFCKNEWAVHLDDVMLRRAGWAYYSADADKVASDVAGWMAEALSWDERRKQEELSEYLEKASPLNAPSVRG